MDTAPRVVKIGSWLAAALCGGAVYGWQVAPDYGHGHPVLAVAAAGGGLLSLWSAEGVFCRADRGRRSQLVLRATFVAFAAITFAALVDSGLRYLELRGTSLPAWATVSRWVFAWSGYDAHAIAGRLTLRTHEGLVHVFPTFEKLGVRPVVCLWAALLVVVGSTRWQRRAQILCRAGALVVLVAFGLWLVTLLFILDQNELLAHEFPVRLALLWQPTLTAAFFGVSTVVLSVCVRVHEPQAPGPRYGFRRTHAAKLGMLAAAGALVGVSLFYYDPGMRKPGRILFDDRLNDVWEQAARRLDTTWFGDFSTYNLSSMVEWLGRRYSVDVNVGRAYTQDLLDRYDVLVVKTPVQALAATEVGAIHEFVDRGGGLLLIGDHTNLLGMSAALNAIAAPYGIQFAYDALADNSHGGFCRYQPGSTGLHPAALGVEAFALMTPCSLILTGGAEAVMVVANAHRDPHDYAHGSYFGYAGSDPALQYGPAVVAAARRAGHGRVLAFADSTVLSSFAFFREGQDRLTLAAIEYLNRANRLPRWLSWAVAAAGCVAALWLEMRARRQSGGLGAAWLVLVAGAAAGCWAGGHATAVMYQPPPCQAPPVELLFTADAPAVTFPPTLGSAADLPAAALFDTLLVSGQRLGFASRVVTEIPEELDPYAALVLVHPERAPAERSLQVVESWVRGGGALILLDRPGHWDHSATGRYLKPFGVTLTHEAGAVHVVGALFHPLSAPDFQAYVARLGDGCVILVVGAEGLSREGLGHCFGVPTAEERARLDSWFLILTHLAGLSEGYRRWYGILE